MSQSPYRMFGRGRLVYWMSGSGREALLDVRQLLGVPRMLGRPSRFFGSHWETIPDVREWSGVTPGSSRVVMRPSRMSVSCREALPDVRESSRVPPGSQGVFGRPTQMSRSGQEALPDVR